MDEQKNIVIAEKQIPRILEFLKYLQENRNDLRKIQEYNRKYSFEKFEEFKPETSISPDWGREYNFKIVKSCNGKSP